MSEKKNIAFFALDILQRFSSEKTPLSLRQISEYLASEHERECDLRTIKSAFSSLQALGFDIRRTIINQNNHTCYAWYINALLDQNDTLRLLLSLYHSNHATVEDIERIVNKLSPFMLGVDISKYFSAQRCKSTELDKLQQNLLVINKSITSRFMMNFPYISYMRGEKPCFERDISGRICEYLVKPICIVCYGEAPRLLAEIGDTGKRRYFKIDHIHQPKLTDIHFSSPIYDRSYLPINKLEKRSPSASDRSTAVLLCDDTILPEIYDALGSQMKILSSCNGKSEVEVVAHYQLLIPFVLHFGNKIEALSPTKLRRAISLELHSCASKYRFQSKLKGYLN